MHRHMHLNALCFDHSYQMLNTTNVPVFVRCGHKMKYRASEVNGEVLIDTNVLSDILISYDWVDLSTHLRKLNLRLIFSLDVLSEAFVGKIPDRVAKRFRNLSILCERIGVQRRGIAATPYSIFKAELEQPQKSTLLLPEEECAWYLSLFADSNQFLERHQVLRQDAENDLRKTEMLESDVEIASAVEKEKWRQVILDVEPELTRVFEESDYGLRAPSSLWIFELFAKRMESSTVPSEIASDGKRYRAIRLNGYYIDLIAISATISSTSRGSHWRMRVKSGNWVDARIAMSAAYCKYLVTEDGDIKKAMELLSPHLHSPPQVLTYREFMALN